MAGIYLLLIILIALAALILVRLGKTGGGDRGSHDELIRISQKVDSGNKAQAENEARLRQEVMGQLQQGLSAQSAQLLNASKVQTETLTGLENRVTGTLASLQDRMVRTLNETTDRMQRSNEEKLNEIRGVVSEKLDKTLNERLDTNFKSVSEQLGKLYRSLGELESLSSGVSDLNRTLSNVKTRGTWGEVQLGHILEQTMTHAQYAENIATKKNSSDRVEFAIKFPGADGTGTPVYLPIDSKFPADIYNHIADAADAGDKAALAAAVNALKARVLDEARTVRDKYLDPPRTTNYAIIFLPTEGLYAEVLRIDGLAEQCMQMGILITGPMTITAVLNSLQAGFRNAALSKKSVEVMKLLEAIKAQFAKMDEEIVKTQKKLSEAAAQTDKLHHRTEIITRRMRQVGEMDADEAGRTLGIEENEE